MKPTLVSFIAFNNDFEKTEDGSYRVKDSGPSATLWSSVLNEYEQHILFLAYSDKPDEQNYEQSRKTSALNTFLKNYKYKEKVELEFLPELKDEIINVNKIKQVINDRLEEKRNSDRITDFEAFISPGTPSMQLAWLLIGLTKEFSLKTFQTKEEKYRKDKAKDLREYIEIESLPFTTALNNLERSKESKEISSYAISASKKSAYNKAEQITQVIKLIPVLIFGETGTGKEDLARYIHKQAINCSKPFLPINCGAFNEETLKAELFGYSDGAFTGAIKGGKRGLLKETEGGTLFLDELGEMSHSMQVSLLRVIQEKTFKPMGSTKDEVFEGRIIAATHRNLKQMCEEGTFRWDLYYRLSTAIIELPTLSQWTNDDKRGLIDELSSEIKRTTGREKSIKLESNALKVLLNYHFPGNIRELQNIITSLYIFHFEEVITDVIISKYLNKPKTSKWKVDDLLHQHALNAYEFFGRNKERTRQELGIAKNTLDKYLQGISVQD